MRKIYDIVLNLNEYAYEFYEWEKWDTIKHFKSINTYKVKNRAMNDFMYYKFKIYNNEFLNQVVIFYDDEKACAFEFDSSGVVINKSLMLFDEEADVLNSMDTVSNIKYKKLSKDRYNSRLTRSENKRVNMLKEKLSKEEDEEKIKYIYYECFNEKENAIKKAHDKIINAIDTNKKVVKKLNKLLMLKKEYKF